MHRLASCVPIHLLISRRCSSVIRFSDFHTTLGGGDGEAAPVLSRKLSSGLFGKVSARSGSVGSVGTFIPQSAPRSLGKHAVEVWTLVPLGLGSTLPHAASNGLLRFRMTPNAAAMACNGAPMALQWQ